MTIKKINRIIMICSGLALLAMCILLLKGMKFFMAGS